MAIFIIPAAVIIAGYLEKRRTVVQGIVAVAYYGDAHYFTLFKMKAIASANCINCH